MKCVYKILLVGMVISLSSENNFCKAQDIHFSQYASSPLNLNPALTGDFNGNLRIAVNHRSQWNAISVPYLSSSISADVKKWDDRLAGDALGIGMVIMHDKSGEGGLRHLQPMMNIAFHDLIGKKKMNYFSIGVQAGVLKKWIDFSKLTFPNQFDEGDFNQNIPSGEDETKYSTTRFDMNAGATYAMKSKTGIELKNGFSLAHLTRPNQSLLGKTNRISMNRIFFSEARIPANENTFIIPQILWMKQNRAGEATIGAAAEHILETQKEDRVLVSCGLNYRWKDAVIFSAGLGFEKWRIGFSYDVNISSLHRATAYRGAYEISIIYIDNLISGRKNVPVVVPCYRL